MLTGPSFQRALYAGFVFPFMLNALLNNVGLRWTLRIWAIMTCVATGIAFLGIRPRVPVSKLHPGQKRPRFIVPQMQYFKSPLFLSFVRHDAITSVASRLKYRRPSFTFSHSPASSKDSPTSQSRCTSRPSHRKFRHHSQPLSFSRSLTPRPSSAKSPSATSPTALRIPG